MLGIRQNENELDDEHELVIEEVAKELSMPVDPDSPKSRSIGQYCVDQLMIMQVRKSAHFVFFNEYETK